jgi:hypothetical protein
VRQPRHQAVGFQPLELLTTGPLDSPVVHRTCPVLCPVHHLTPALTLRAQSTLFTVALQTTVGACSRCSAWHTGQAGATSDSPVNYSRVVPRIPEAEQFIVILPGAPDSVRWCTGYYPMAHRTVRCTRPGQPLVALLLSF